MLFRSCSVTPLLLMYHNDGNVLHLSVSNPDLALYSGESDEIFSTDGKRIERSVYGRKWITNPSAEVTVDIVLNGIWEIEDMDITKVDITTEGNTTHLHIATNECKSERIILKRK